MEIFKLSVTTLTILTTYNIWTFPFSNLTIKINEWKTKKSLQLAQQLVALKMKSINQKSAVKIWAIISGIFHYNLKNILICFQNKSSRLHFCQGTCCCGSGAGSRRWRTCQEPALCRTEQCWVGVTWAGEGLLTPLCNKYICLPNNVYACSIILSVSLVHRPISKQGLKEAWN